MLALTLMLSFNVTSDVIIYHTSLKSVKDRTAELNKDPVFKNYNVTVFGKYRDFSQTSKRITPSVIIAPSFFRSEDYKPVYQLTKNGGSEFQFLIVALSSFDESQDVSKLRLGLVQERDLKDRSYLKNYFSKTKFSGVKLARSVTKPDDLIPMLVYGNADFIIIRKENYDALSKKYNVKLKILGKTNKVPVEQIYIHKNVKPAAVEAIGKMKSDTLKALGFDGIKKLDSE